MLLDGLPRAPRELQGQLTDLIREFLLTLRSLIDWYLDRLDQPRRDPRWRTSRSTDVQGLRLGLPDAPRTTALLTTSRASSCPAGCAARAHLLEAGRSAPGRSSTHAPAPRASRCRPAGTTSPAPAAARPRAAPSATTTARWLRSARPSWGSARWTPRAGRLRRAGVAALPADQRQPAAAARRARAYRPSRRRHDPLQAADLRGPRRPDREGLLPGVPTAPQRGRGGGWLRRPT